MPKAISQPRLNSVLSGLDVCHSYAILKRNTALSHGSTSRIRSTHRPDLKRPAGGCPPKLSPTAVRHAVRLVTNCNSVSTTQATQTLCEVSGISIHPQIVRRALKDASLRPVKKVKKPKLTRKARRQRIAFANAHRYWTQDDRRRVLWSDETRLTA